jgi:ABC-type multidrug transport system fused ATPase/permease subunit
MKQMQAEHTAKKSMGAVLKSGIGLSMGLMWRESKPLIVRSFLNVIILVALPFLGILLPKLVIDLIEAQATPLQFIVQVGGAAVLLVVAYLASGFFSYYVQRGDVIGIVGVMVLLRETLKKKTDMDYEVLESPAYQEVDKKIDQANQGNHSPALNIPVMLVEVIANFAGFVLFAGVIIAISPIILPLVVLTAALNYYMIVRARKYMERTRASRSQNLRYVTAIHDVLENHEAGKDIRLYKAQEWLDRLAYKYFSRFLRGERQALAKDMQSGLVDASMSLVRDGVAYFILIGMVLAGTITVGNFVFVFGAVGTLATWIAGFLQAAGDLQKACVQMDDVRTGLEYPDQMNRAAGVPLPTQAELPPTITLRNLVYQYPSGVAPALQGIDLTIAPGERIAIVGTNGAGKSTLVKLISGLYVPTQGEVLLNGHSTLAYNRDEYYSLFSVVFQDIRMLPLTIAENISLLPRQQTDDARVRECLAIAGLLAKVEALPDGLDTHLVRSVHADAVQLSGGEMQKLAMARAIYKDAPVLILDEPTAALDPLAEDEVYMKYAELTAGRTSIYISHRLASTRFCDRILLLDGNIIAEQGTHDELMALQGIYAHMFQVQASYYQADKVEVQAQ